jgi:hypothetical protein
MPYVVFSLVDRCEDLLKIKISIESLRMKLIIVERGCYSRHRLLGLIQRYPLVLI